MLNRYNYKYGLFLTRTGGGIIKRLLIVALSLISCIAVAFGLSACDGCGQKEVDRHSHEYIEVVTQPTCTANGYSTYTCECGSKYVSNYVDPLGHSYDGDTCTRCGWIRHDHIYTKTEVAATCTEGGYTRGVCDVCGATYTAYYSDPLGHDLDNGFCSRCEYFNPEEHEHRYEHTAVEADCVSEGYTAHSCYCGYSYKDNYLPVTGHDHVQGKCIRCGDILGTEGLEYSIIEDGDTYYLICIGKGDVKDTDIIIPPEVNGVPVKEIKNDAFRNRKDLTSVVFFDSITLIGGFAFEGCSNLKEITFGTGVCSIGKWAFEDCASLQNLKIPATVLYIGYGAFAGCTGLESIEVDKGNWIYSGAGNCLLENRETVIVGCKNSVIPADGSVKYIGEYAFESCKALKSIVIPQSIKQISNYAFMYCDGLQEITIPGSVEQIGYGAFRECKNLTRLTIEEGVKQIHDSVFYRCENLRYVTIPNSVTEIGRSAFDNCKSVKKLTAPAKALSTIALTSSSTFMYRSTELEDLTITGGTEIESGMFTSFTGLKNVLIYEGVTSIGDRAFAYCTSLTSVILPDSVKQIGDQAFFRCDSLIKMFITLNVTEIGISAFGGCDKLTVYCEATSKPAGWSSSWNSYSNRACRVLWGWGIPPPGIIDPPLDDDVWW